MAEEFYIKTFGMDDMEKDFKKASVPRPTKSFKKLDRLLDAAFAATQSKVHVETGRLKMSGRVDNHYLFDVWIGEIKYLRHPGIFELARGDTPTKLHPSGGHFFFEAIDPFIPHMETAINDVFSDYFGAERKNLP